MDNVKQLYIDLYKTNFSEDGLTIIDNKHKVEIKVTSRYKDFIMTYDNESNS